MDIAIKRLLLLFCIVYFFQGLACAQYISVFDVPIVQETCMSAHISFTVNEAFVKRVVVYLQDTTGKTWILAKRNVSHSNIRVKIPDVPTGIYQYVVAGLNTADKNLLYGMSNIFGITNNGLCSDSSSSPSSSC